MDLQPAGTGRLIVALGIMAVLAVCSTLTMEPGKYRSLVYVLLGFFSFRVLLGWYRSRGIG